MCGIVSFTGHKEALPFLMQGLSKLEYRGYDSAGVTLVSEKGLVTKKAKGRLTNLEKELDDTCSFQTTGIGHTRWATHGVPSQLNSHPHTNEKETLSIVHNGIIENYQELKAELIESGVTFQSQTDSEVIVHLLDHYYQGDLFAALQKTVARLEGSYAICVLDVASPDVVWVAKQSSPLIVAQADGCCACASDIPALLELTSDMIVLEDGQIAKLTPDSISLYDFFGHQLQPSITHIPYDVSQAQKDGYDTYMEKEIFEQAHAIEETIRGRGHVAIEKFEDVDMIYMVGCGTAYHACLYGQALLQRWTNKSVSCMVASEFRYAPLPMTDKTLCIFVSQSGETADTLAALEKAQAKQAHTLSICNVLDSSLARNSEFTLYTCAGPEISVASTKAYTTQLTCLAIACMNLAHLWDPSFHLKEAYANLKQLPKHMANVLKTVKDSCAGKEALFAHIHDAYYLGRQLDHISALEGALKLKEISYIHADAYYAGELKHGPIALIEQGTVVIALACQKELLSKTLSNLQETKARGAHVLLITPFKDAWNDESEVLFVDEYDEIWMPILVAPIFQYLAYLAACVRGCDVDKPRNLAKSVTVE